jgi:hypothetical protein
MKALAVICVLLLLIAPLIALPQEEEAPIRLSPAVFAQCEREGGCSLVSQQWLDNQLSLAKKSCLKGWT